MLSLIRPLMTEQVEHLIAPKRDVFGQPFESRQATSHAARVVYAAGKISGSASAESLGDAKAIVWLTNHPRPIAIGDLFELPDGDTLAVMRAEARKLGGETLHKVFLS